MSLVSADWLWDLLSIVTTVTKVDDTELHRNEVLRIQCDQLEKIGDSSRGYWVLSVL